MGAIDEGIDKERAQCGRCRDMLHELARIHLEIDAPKRRIGADDPDWILRLRKVCLHALAISKWEVSVDTVHVMATELRAAYVQMDAVWKCMPGEFRLDRMDGSWWATEARAGVLATFDHPTPWSLAFPLAQGGFGDVEDPMSYLQLAVWLGLLGVGYGLALTALAQVLGAEGDVAYRVALVMRRNTQDLVLPSLTARTWWSPFFVSNGG